MGGAIWPRPPPCVQISRWPDFPVPAVFLFADRSPGFLWRGLDDAALVDELIKIAA